MAARPRFELGKCQSQSLMPYRLATGQYGGVEEIRTPVQKIFTNHKSHSYLTGFVYTVLSLLFTIYKSQEQVLMLKLFTQEFIRINLFARQSLLVNTIMLYLIAYWYSHKSYLSLTTQMKRN